MLRHVISTAGRSCHAARFFTSNSASSTLSALVLTDVDIKTGYATVTLNRAPVNGMSLEMLAEVSNVVDELERAKVKGMILTSFSDKVFCAGLDILEMINPNPDRLRTFWTGLQDLWVRLYGCNFPSVAVINGHAPAGGCLIAITCDYRVMNPNFIIGLNETALGLVVPPWLQITMGNVIGVRQSELSCTTGKLFTTQEALQIGLIDEIAPDSQEAMKRAICFLDKFKYISPFARSSSKLTLRNRDIANFRRYREQDTESFIKNVLATEFQDGLAKYMKELKTRKSG